MSDEKPWMKKMQAQKEGTLEPPPIAKTIGFELVDFAEGRAVFSLVGDPSRHANPMGSMHGGVLVDVGDASMGYAMASTLDAGESFTTVELQAHYFKPVWTAKLRAEAKVVKRSRTLGYIECEVTDEGGALVCKLSSTCMVLRGDAARGR